MTEGFQGLTLLESAVSAIAQANTPAEIFRELVVGTGCGAPRAVVFLLRDRHWKGWKATGYGSLVAQAAQSVALSDRDGWLARVATSDEPWLEAAGEDSVPDFGQATSQTAIAFPVRVGDKAVAIVLAERGAGERPWHPEALAVLVQAVRLRLEFDLACRRLRAAGVAASEDAPAVASEPASVSTGDDALMMAADPSRAQPYDEAPVIAPDLSSASSYDDEPSVAPELSSAETYDAAPAIVPDLLGAQTYGDAPAVATGAATAAPSMVELDPWMEPAPAPPSNPEHDEARRFARLVATDIRLYNEEAVAHGRVEGDLAARLGAQMQKGRESFERRFPSLGQEGMTILRDSFVQVLAGGDASLIPPD